ncbi:hypothetical protein TO65_33610, partial [Pseudomonas aeruginosa]
KAAAVTEGGPLHRGTPAVRDAAPRGPTGLRATRRAAALPGNGEGSRGDGPVERARRRGQGDPVLRVQADRGCAEGTLRAGRARLRHAGGQ